MTVCFLGLAIIIACAALEPQRARRTPWLRALLTVGMLATVGSSLLRAQAPAQAQETPPPQPEAEARPKLGIWSEGTPRFFISQKSEFGTPYAKPYVSFGYGLPFWIWTGLDFNSILTTSMFQVYGGARLASPILDLAWGIRDTWSFDKPFLAPEKSFSRADVLNGAGDRARYWAWEAEAVLTVPLPYSAIVGDLIAIRTLDVPKDHYVYDESYRAVTKNPLFFTLRVAAVARFLKEEAFKVGVLSEYVFATGRDQIVFRLGPAASVQLTDHLEINAALTLAVSSPDHLGLVLGTYGVAGVRYRWASGEKHPKWPWQEPIIPF